MNRYFYLKAKSYPKGDYDVVAEGGAPTDALARAQAQPGEIVCCVVEGTEPWRSDQDEIARAKKMQEEAAAKAAAKATMSVEEGN